MAFADLFQQQNAGNGKVAGASWTFAAYGTAPSVGNLVVYALAKDNAATADGNTSEVTSVTDDAGNTYVKAREFCNGQGAANAGATISVWYCVIANAVTGANRITAQFSSSVTSAAANGYSFSIGTSSVAVVGEADLANDGADPGSLATAGGLSSAARLYFRASALEAASGTAITATATWSRTATTTGGTSGGGGASNMSVAAEFKIATSTGETSDFTVAAADCASVIVAFEEIVVSTDTLFAQICL